MVNGMVGAFYYQSRSSTAFTTKAATLDADMQTLSITDTTYEVFAYNKSLFTIYKNGTPLTCDFSIQIGHIKLSEIQTAGTFTISGSYVPLEQVGSVFEFSVGVRNNLLTTVEYGDTWEHKVPSYGGWVTTFKRYWVDKHISQLIMDYAEDVYVFKFFTDVDNSHYWIGYGYIGGVKLGSNTNKISDESGLISGQGPIFFRGD